MPRDITILSPHVVDSLDLATAARAVDESFGVREIDGGDALQVFAAGGEAVLRGGGPAHRRLGPGRRGRLPVALQHPGRPHRLALPESSAPAAARTWPG